MDFEKLIDRCMRTIDDRNLTNRDVARLADISESTVSRVLASRGRNASMATIVAICDGLGLEEETVQYDVSPNDMTAIEHIYLARIDDLKKSIAQKDRWIKGLFAICLSMVIIMVALLAVDLLVPTVGWFRG